MRNDLTTGLNAARSKQANAPALLLRLVWPALGSFPSLTLNLADRPLVTGADTWQALVLDWKGNRTSGEFHATLWNGPVDFGQGPERFSDVLQAYPPETATAILYRWFDDEGLDENDLAPIFTGYMAHPIEYDESECSFRLQVFSEDLGRLSIGSRITASDYPNVPDDNLGKTKPIVVGAVENVPGLRVRRVNRTELISAVIPGATIVNVASTGDFPSAGVLVINDDEVNYTGVLAQQFTGCSGIEEFHYSGDEVLEKVSDHRFLFSDPSYPIQGISNVKVSGNPVDPVDYSLDLGKGEVVFAAQPRKVQSIDTKFLQAQFDQVASGNTALDPEFAMQPNLKTRYARINQATPKLKLRQIDPLAPIGQIGRVLLRVEHFMEEKLNLDSVAVNLSGVGQIATLSPPGADDLAQTTGSTDITHNHLDTFGFPIDIPLPAITPTSQADHVIEQGATSGIGKNINLIAGLITTKVKFPSAPPGATRGEYQININIDGGLFGFGDAIFYLHGQKVAEYNLTRLQFDFFPSFTLNTSVHPTEMTFSVGSNGGQWTIDIISVKRLLFYPHDTQASQQAQQTLKSGGNTQTSLQPALNTVTEKSTRTVVDFFDITSQVNGDWAWFTNRDVEITYTGTGDGRTVFVLHTAFEVEYARRRLTSTDDVSADVQGLVDDVQGTLTGTPNLLLERPDHVFRWSLQKFLSFPASFLDEVAFDAAGTRFLNEGGYPLAGVIQSQQKLSNLWEAWSISSRSELLWNSIGQARLLYRQLNSSAGLEGLEVKTLDDSRVLLHPKTKRPRFRLRRMPNRFLSTYLETPYSRNWKQSSGSAPYGKLLSVQDPVQAGIFGWRTHPGGWPLDWCSNDAMAQNLADFYLAEFARPQTLLECDAVLQHMDLEPGDIVKLDHPNAGLDQVFAEVIRLEDILGQEGVDGLDAVRLHLRLFPIELIQQVSAEVSETLETLDIGLSWSPVFSDNPEAEEVLLMLDIPGMVQENAQSVETFLFDAVRVEQEFPQTQEQLLVDYFPATFSKSVEISEGAFVSATGGWGVQAWGISGWGGQEVLS